MTNRVTVHITFEFDRKWNNQFRSILRTVLLERLIGIPGVVKVKIGQINPVTGRNWTPEKTDDYHVSEANQ